ncbi:MAG: tRNA guanosine(34) transglycosylase Tgt [Nanoarchaeota archaeon]
MSIKFKILSENKKARTAIVKASHGIVHTPTLIPVATLASIKSLTPEDLQRLNIEIIIANTFHLYLRPGPDVIKKLGGLHKFMSFNKTIMTDSGGFQAFSLGLGLEHGVGKIITGNNIKKSRDKLALVEEDGVIFRSPIDNSKYKLTPDLSIKVQENLGADIIYALDECTSPLSDYKYTKESLERTHRWAQRCLEIHKTNQSLFGIVQGGEFKDLRTKSAKFISSLDFDGYGIGGVFGKSKEHMYDVIDWSIKPLDENKPRHLLGIGAIEDIFECVELGIDLFDCVAPTRLARMGYLFITPKSKGNKENKFRIRITNKIYKLDKTPIDKYCKCYTCKNFSKAYLRHLFVSNELTYHRLATYHNLYYFIDLFKQIRESIDQNKFSKLKRYWLK